MNSLGNSNNGNWYILTCINILSKYAWAFPLKNKKGDKVIQIFDKIFNQGRIPIKLQSDGGHEFNNALFKKYMKENGVHITLQPEMKPNAV